MILKKIRNYNKLPVEFKATLWYTLSNVLQKGIAFLTIPIFTRLLSVQQFGLFTLYNSWVTIIAVFTTLRLEAGVFNNGMIKYDEDKDTFLVSLLGLSNIITLVLYFIYLIYSEFWNNLLGLPTILIHFMFIHFFFTPSFSLWSSRQRFENKYQLLIFVTIISSILTPLAAVLAIYNLNYDAAILRIVASSIVSIAIGIIFYLNALLRSRKLFSSKYWMFALKFNVPLIPHYLSNMILSQADRIMIGWYIGQAEAGLYGLVYNISLMLSIIISAINASFIPKVYKSLRDEEYNKIMKYTNYLVIFVSLMSMVIMLIGPEIVKIISTKEYHAAIYVIPPVASSIFFMFISTQFINIEFYFEKTIYTAIASSIGAVINVVLNYILLPSFGYLAAAYTTLFCYILFALSHFLIAMRLSKKYIKNQRIHNINIIVLFSTINIVSIIVSVVLYQYIVLRYTLIVLLLLTLFIKRKDIFSIYNKLRC